MSSTHHNEILHTSRQLHCRDVCKIPLWSVKHILNYSASNFDPIWNSIEISLVGWAPGTHFTIDRWAHNWLLIKIHISLIFNSNGPIQSKFCTSQDNSAVMIMQIVTGCDCYFSSKATCFLKAHTYPQMIQFQTWNHNRVSKSDIPMFYCKSLI